MQLIDGQPVFSATDLVGYLACEHLTALERAALAGLVQRPVREDRELDVIRKRGFQHEARYLADLAGAHRVVVEVARDDEADRGDEIRRQAAETLAAMASGADVIYQATFFDGRWLGYADFLLRVESPERPSVWGPFHYEVADTKLARHVKAGAVLQMCSYVEQLERLQRVRPELMKVVLGGSAHETAALRVDDYMAYYRAAKDRFEATMLDGAPAAYPPTGTYPEPVEHCDVCRWAELCAVRRREDDHLSLVAGITARQRKALSARELDTVTRLAAAPIPFDPPLDGSSAASVERVREQARIQVEGRGLKKPIHELLVPPPGAAIDAERGLAILPEPDSGDLFLDLEGDPYALEDGVDYLFGLMDTSGEFTAIWSFDPDRPGDVTLAGEKRAFEELIDLICARLEAHPGMHVYHYAAYEPTALKRLMGRHATREEAVDRLLRGGVLVDLYRAVRQGLRASVESYSIKKIEALYDFTRSEGLRDAGSSIVEFETWLELGEGERPASEILTSIAAYNRDDVLSTLRLRGWLEVQRGRLAEQTGLPVPRPAPRSGDAPEQLREADEHVQEVAERLTAGVPDDPAERQPEQHATWLLAQLLSWHRREAKVAFWEFFNRLGMDLPELMADKAAIGPLEVVGPVGGPYLPTPRARYARQRWRYRFAPQDYDIGPLSELYDPRLYREQPAAQWREWKVRGELIGVDEAAATLDIAWPADAAPSHPEALIPLNIIRDVDQRAALLRLGEWVAEHGIDAHGPWQAARRVLLRRPPSMGQDPGAPLRQPGETELDAACRLVELLDEDPLAIQGPPGSGKTYAGAHMIARLLASGKRVGIAANSHKVISNLLATVLEYAGDADVRAVQRANDEGSAVADPRVRVAKNNGEVLAGLADGTFNLAAGTSWLWSPEGLSDSVDVLFVDEAGQVSLANVLAMAGATRSIVLLGDPQQLDQPLQGSHPPGADRSALAHLLGPHDAMPDDLGLFLARTWRLHPSITTFTSSAFYEDKLASRDGLERQQLQGPAPLRGAGLRLLPVDHVGSESESPEEARVVAAMVRTLVESGSTWIDRDGKECPLRYGDVLIVAPFNAQVGAIARELPEARVGTVDKFQGQEAPISIYSMTSSSAEDAPRGMTFLYSRNRLNVATSRARCIAVVVASPALLRVRARTPEQMRLANALCQFAELAAEAAVSGSRFEGTS
jgi:uncharacterized protein